MVLILEAALGEEWWDDRAPADLVRHYQSKLPTSFQTIYVLFAWHYWKMRRKANFVERAKLAGGEGILAAAASTVVEALLVVFDP